MGRVVRFAGVGAASGRRKGTTTTQKGATGVGACISHLRVLWLIVCSVISFLYYLC
jgi:hypothetical protein